jgi:DNA-binding MarR family transcriptional regulator
MSHFIKESNKILSKWQRSILNSDLLPTTRHVLLTLSIYMDPSGTNAWPSIRRLGKDMGRSKGTVSKHILIAESRGFLKVHRNSRGECKGWRKNKYSARFPVGVSSRSTAKSTVPVDNTSCI